MKGSLYLGAAVAATIILLGTAPLGQSPSFAAATVTDAAARLVGIDGKPSGVILFSQTATGVRIEINGQRLPPGAHAIHIHAVGKCENAKGFASAGAHFDVGTHVHGKLNTQGPHSGDLANQVANKLGFMRGADITRGFTLGPGQTSLFDADGSAIVIHMKPDDYKTQPAGDSGDRIACGVIKPM